MVSFISFFVRVSSELLINKDEGFILILLLTKLYPASKRGLGTLLPLTTLFIILMQPLLLVPSFYQKAPHEFPPNVSSSIAEFLEILY